MTLTTLEEVAAGLDRSAYTATPEETFQLWSNGELPETEEEGLDIDQAVPILYDLLRVDKPESARAALTYVKYIAWWVENVIEHTLDLYQRHPEEWQ